MHRADIVEIVSQFVRLKRRGGNYIANCPFHNEKSPSFSVSQAKGIFKCFGCGRGGNVVNFLQEHEKLSWPEAIRWLADFYKITLEETEVSPEQQVVHQAAERLRLINEYAARFFHTHLRSSEEGQAIGLSYFRQRGFRDDIIDRFQLGYNSEQGREFVQAATAAGYQLPLLERAGLVKSRDQVFYDQYRGRVIFPIHSMSGRVLGFGARVIKKTDKAPKYINSPEHELYIKSRVLYGLYQSRQAIVKADECYLVEGYTDVLSLHQGGVENVVASSGTSLTEDQLRLIGQLTRNLTILYDSDAAGIKAALRGLDMALTQRFQVRLVLLPEGEDPDSMIQKNGGEAFRAYAQEHRQDVISFRMEVGLREAGDDPVARNKLVNEVAETIALIDKAEDFSLQEHYVRLATRRLGVTHEGFLNLVNKYIRDRVGKSQKQASAAEALPTEEAPTTSSGATPELMDETQEWELIRVLLDHGHKAWEGYPHVADFIFDRVVIDDISSDMVREVFEMCWQYRQQHHKPPPADCYLTYPNPEVQQRLAMAMQPRTAISANWSKNYGIETISDTWNYANEVESALMYFELRKIIQVQEELTAMLAKENDPRRIRVLQEQFLELRHAEKEITRKHGAVVYRLLQRR